MRYLIKRMNNAFSRGGLSYLIVKLLDQIGKPFGINFESFLFKFKHDEYFKDKDLINANIKNKFDEIYNSNYWSSEESVSGNGSELSYANNYIDNLADFLKKNEVKSIFDAPCGDFNWVQKVLEQRDIKYTGGDIVEKLIKKNQELYPNFYFCVFDITKDEFPNCDIWHCRDCLFHLSYNDIHKALNNFLSSNIELALITTHRSLALKNRDIDTGYFRYTDFEKPPFNFPKPNTYLKDFSYGRNFPRYVGCWDRSQIKTALEEWNMS